MKATYNGQSGELTIEHCCILRYMEIGKIRKFYQQMRVQFSTAVGSPVADSFWSVSNWGPGAEAPWSSGSDLKGGLKSESQASSYLAEQANDRQENIKVKGGYTFYSEFSAGANVTPPPKLLAELGVRTHDLLLARRDVEPTPETNRRWQSLLDLRATATELSSNAMLNLMNGDLASAIKDRQTLIDLMNEVRALHEAGEGQLEMLTLKLTGELKK